MTKKYKPWKYLSQTRKTWNTCACMSGQN